MRRADRYLSYDLIASVGGEPPTVNRTDEVELLDGGCKLIRPARFAGGRLGGRVALAWQVGAGE